MIVAYSAAAEKICATIIDQNNHELLVDAVWIDLLRPTQKEENILETYLQLDIPTKEEMKEIEPSSRLYVDADALFMTATMIANSETIEYLSEAVTFVLTSKQLITIRYIEPLVFKSFISRLLRGNSKKFDAAHVLTGLLESVSDRLADILENVSHKFDEISSMIFMPKDHEAVDYKQILQRIGLNGELGTKVRESLASFMRLLTFLENSMTPAINKSMQVRLKVVVKDMSALSDYANYISFKVNFLLDATLGMVGIEQNNIIKIFSVAAVIFLPPTLIASIYGMNFHNMPELSWRIGYPIALFFMVLSAWLPYRFFKMKKWL